MGRVADAKPVWRKREDIAFASQKLTFLRRSETEKLCFSVSLASLKGRTYGSHPHRCQINSRLKAGRLVFSPCEVLLYIERARKKAEMPAFNLNWRKREDSNLRYGYPHTRFPSVLLKPLGHTSALEPFYHTFPNNKTPDILRLVL